MALNVASSADNGMTVLLLVLCATVIMIMLLRRHQFRGATRRDMARDHVARVRDQHRLHQSMDELLVQLEEVSRNVGAQVETRFAKLEKVISDADDRIARLEHMLGHSSTEASRPRANTPSTPARPPARLPRRDDAGAAPERGPDTSPPVKPIDPRFQRVYDLVDAGASPIKAAQQLNMPLGEVELILNLRDLR
jgi:hypothetical protein